MSVTGVGWGWGLRGLGGWRLGARGLGGRGIGASTVPGRCRGRKPLAPPDGRFVWLRAGGGLLRSSPRPYRGGVRGFFGCGTVGAGRAVPRAPGGWACVVSLAAARWGLVAQFPAPLPGVACVVSLAARWWGLVAQFLAPLTRGVRGFFGWGVPLVCRVGRVLQGRGELRALPPPGRGRRNHARPPDRGAGNCATSPRRPADEETARAHPSGARGTARPAPAGPQGGKGYASEYFASAAGSRARR